MVTNEETEWGNGFLFDYKLEEDLNDKYQNANLINHEHIGDILEWLDKEVENEKSM